MATARQAESLKASDEASYVEFVDAYQAALRRIAYAVSGNWSDADDLLQTALIKLYRAWPRVKRDGREFAYARQIIVRSNLDERRRPRQSREYVGLPSAHRSATSHDPEVRTDLMEALRKLAVRQRTAVLLRYWVGLSVAETAHEMRISEGAVKSTSHKGLTQLRTQLGESYGGVSTLRG